MQLEQAIKSVLQQTFTDYEFIIYDDGSDRNVHEYLKEYAKMDKRIILISDPVNHGLAYSLNTCINVAKGIYLARMDDDDICEPERFAVQCEFLDHHPEIAFVGCNAKLIDDRGVWGIRQMPEDPDKHSFLRFSPFIHPTVMIRRRVLEGGNTYRCDKNNWRCEDYELFMRLWKLGHRGYNIQRELFCYREDRHAYKKRKFRYRIDEMLLRRRNFRELGMSGPFTWFFVIRPLVAGIVPSWLILQTKRLYHRIHKKADGADNNHERRNGKETAVVSQDPKSAAAAVLHIRKTL